MGKDTKFCRNCGKELPIESTFCPYCMTKLIDVTTGGEIKVKRKTDYYSHCVGGCVNCRDCSDITLCKRCF